MRRPSPLAAGLALALAATSACEDEQAADCPGEPVGTFQFGGTLVSAGDPSIAGLDPVDVGDAPDCPAAWYPAELPAFEATLSADPAGSAAALCRTRGTVLFGPRTGDRFMLETRTDGGVLGEQCAATCSTDLRLIVVGDVARVGGEAVSFGGVLVEVMSPAAGSACGACTLPCAARYRLEGTP